MPAIDDDDDDDDDEPDQLEPLEPELELVLPQARFSLTVPAAAREKLEARARIAVVEKCILMGIKEDYGK